MFYFLQVKDSEIFECHSNITCILSNFTNRPESHPSCLPIPKPQPRRSIVSRPSYYGDSDLPTIEEEESVTVSIEMYVIPKLKRIFCSILLTTVVA